LKTNRKQLQLNNILIVDINFSINNCNPMTETVDFDDESTLESGEEQPTETSRGRPKKVFTEAELRSIGVMAGYGLPVGHMAAILGVSESTLYRNKKWNPTIKEAYDKGLARARITVAKVLFEKATVDRDMTAIIWYEKTRCGMRERTEEAPQQINLDRPQTVSIYLPENNRD